MKNLFFALAALLVPALGFADGPVRLGTTLLGNNSDVTPIQIPNTCGITKFKLRVIGGDRAFIDFIAVDFVRNGAPRQRLQVNSVIRNGEGTGWLDLRGNQRCIDKVFVHGDSRGSRQPSLVEVVGYREDRFVPTPPIRDNDGVRLGEARISEGRDFDSVNVANVCGLRQVKLKVRGDDARIDFVAVRFVGTGTYQQIPVRENFRAGSESNWKDLNGNRRCIDSFYVMGRSSNRPRDARVILVGR